MFDWFKRRNRASAVKEARIAVTAAVDATLKLGEILENSERFLVMDSSMLPLPKPQMKFALQIAWKVATEGQMRESVEGCYLGLATFQDGVGSEPIAIPDSENVKNLELAEVTTTLKDMTHWTAKIASEMHRLRMELDEFVRSEGAEWLRNHKA